jgi:hypothetical protein
MKSERSQVMIAMSKRRGLLRNKATSQGKENCKEVVLECSGYCLEKY